MGSALLLGGFAVLGVLQVLLMRRIASLPNDVRFGIELDRHRRAEIEQAEAERIQRRRLRRLTFWVERYHERLGTEVRLEIARIAALRAADGEKLGEAAKLVEDVRELHAAARSIVIELRTHAEGQRQQTLRVPERRPPPLPVGKERG
jgi:hypothetical protein